MGMHDEDIAWEFQPRTPSPDQQRRIDAETADHRDVENRFHRALYAEKKRNPNLNVAQFTADFQP